MSPRETLDPTTIRFRRCLADFQAALAKWNSAVAGLDRVARRMDHLARQLGGYEKLEQKQTSRLTKLRAKRKYIGTPSDRLTRRFGNEYEQAKLDIQSVINIMRSHIVTLAASTTQTKEHLSFFDSLAEFPSHNSGPILAFIERVIRESEGGDLTFGFNDNSSDQVTRANREAQVPDGFAARLEAAMNANGHTREAACAAMDGMDPKTLRKVLAGTGPVRSETLRQANEYIKSSLLHKRQRFADAG